MLEGNRRLQSVLGHAWLLTVVFAVLVDGEANITYYGKERTKALGGIIRQLISSYKNLGLTEGKIPSELAAIGGIGPFLGAGSDSIEGNIHGFVHPEGASKDTITGPPPQLPNDESAGSSVGSAIQNLTQFLNSGNRPNSNIPIDGGFTEWTAFSKCPNSCGRTALRSRERYCTNPAPANGGKNCEGPRFQLKLCKLKDCPVDGGYTAWTAWSRCTQKCGKGSKHRHRYCTNPAPMYGGKTCEGRRREIKHCYGKMCNDQNSIVDIDPKTVCGYDPCNVAKCISSPYATCVSDFKCKPVFFDSEERRVEECKGARLYLTIDPDTVCRFNPCKYTTCTTLKPAKCLVNTKCQPVFLDAFGKELDCKGVFKVPARYICGHNPCSNAMCKSEPSARCLVDHTCKPVFVNAEKQTYKQCSERGQIVENNLDDEDSDAEETADQEDSEDSLSRLMKGKHQKHRKPASDSDSSYVNDDSDNGEGDGEEKKSKLHLASRFLG